MVGQRVAADTLRMRLWFATSRLNEWGTWNKTATELVTWLEQYETWTRCTYETNLRSLYAYLTDTGQLKADPLARMRSSPTPQPHPKPLSEAELTRVLSTAEGEMYAWLILASKAGLRLHEIAKIRGQDVDQFGITVLGKGAKLARLPAHPLIRDLAEDYPSTGYWFPSGWGEREHRSRSSIGNLVRAHFRANGVPTGSIHRCRATYGTMLVRSGVSIRVVQDLMRHSSLATTQLYLGVNEDERVAAIGGI